MFGLYVRGEKGNWGTFLLLLLLLLPKPATCERNKERKKELLPTLPYYQGGAPHYIIILKLKPPLCPLLKNSALQILPPRGPPPPFSFFLLPMAFEKAVCVPFSHVVFSFYFMAVSPSSSFFSPPWLLQKWYKGQEGIQQPHSKKL